MSDFQHFLLVYEIAADYLQRRGQFRDEHLSLAWKSVERGELVLGGAVGDPLESSLLLFRATTPDVVVRFATADPYVQHGLVTKWTVKPWHTVAGNDAAAPLRPSIDPA